MSHYELTITPTYAREWTVCDAVRELFQNALDQQTVDTTNKIFFEYDNGTLRVGNKLSTLEAVSLLLGATTKANVAETIGQFGEGYKIAMLVLTREGHPMTIYNYGKRESWTPRFKKSRKYKTDILCVDTKLHIWPAPPHNNLVIEIEDISVDQYNEIVNSNLHLQDNVKVVFEGNEGRVLDKETHAGKVFVNGLYVTKQDQLMYGYDFKPQHLPLGRDRNMAKAFDIEWLTSTLWRRQDTDLLHDLIRKGCKDVNYVATSVTSPPKEIASSSLARFVEEHGPKAVPVTTQYEVDEINEKFTDAVPVIVTEVHKQVLRDIKPDLTPVAVIIPEDPLERLDLWIEKVMDYITEEAYEEFKEIRLCLK